MARNIFHPWASECVEGEVEVDGWGAFPGTSIEIELNEDEDRAFDFSPSGPHSQGAPAQSCCARTQGAAC